jgi:hypothetical protein
MGNTMTPVRQAERRRSVRVRFNGPVRAEQIPQVVGKDVCHLLSADLSERGLRLSSPAFLPADSLVLLDLDTPGPAAPIRAVGRVAWAQQAGYGDRWRLGVEFAELSDDARSRLRKIVKQRPVARLR